MSFSPTKLIATAHGEPDETVTIEVRFRVTPEEAKIIDAGRNNVAVFIRALVAQWAAPLVKE